MTLVEKAGLITTMYVVGVTPWLRWIYLTTRKAWQVPVRVAKLHSGRMTSDSDYAGLI